MSQKPTVHTQQLGFTLPIAILIVVILIVAGGVGYYFYKTLTPKEALSICNKIDNEDERKYCNHVVRGEEEKCEKEDCYIMIATRNQNPDLCKNISGPERQSLCEAFANRDPAWCETIKGEMKPICYLYAALLIEDLKGCEKSINPELCKAVITKNPTLCGQLSSKVHKEDCYYKVGAIKGDPDLCEYVTDLGKRKACQKIAAKDISDLTCQGGENKICGFIAVLKQDSSICEKTSLQGECYTMIAFSKIGFMPKYFSVAIEDILPSLIEELSEEEKKEEAKRLINEALLKIEQVKSEEDSQKLQLLISEAIEYGKNAVELDPKNPEILFQMGNIYFEIKEIVSGADVWARYYYEKALELDPNNPVYQEKLREIQP